MDRCAEAAKGLPPSPEEVLPLEVRFLRSTDQFAFHFCFLETSITRSRIPPLTCQSRFCIGLLRFQSVQEPGSVAQLDDERDKTKSKLKARRRSRDSVRTSDEHTLPSPPYLVLDTFIVEPLYWFPSPLRGVNGESIHCRSKYAYLCFFGRNAGGNLRAMLVATLCP